VDKKCEGVEYMRGWDKTLLLAIIAVLSVIIFFKTL
jgi:hypothetical protein